MKVLVDAPGLSCCGSSAVAIIVRSKGFQDDIVHIHRVGNKLARERRTLRNYGLPMIEFQKKIIAWRNAGYEVPITFSYEGQRFTYDDITKTEVWDQDSSPALRYLLDFRKIQMDGKPNRCRW